jgi:chloramphenicol-sensitive protein RarD
MTEAPRGVLAMAAAASIWGLSSMYYKALSHVPPLELLSHRSLWSMAFFGIILMLQGRADDIRSALRDPVALRTLAISAAMISSNWFGFIYAVQFGQALEASLGYYIYPLLAVLVGYAVLKERFSRLQSLAIALAAAAVLILAAGLGTPPWIALWLAGTMPVYGLLKKRLALGPVLSVFLETLLLAPIALAWLFGVHMLDWPDVGGEAGGVFGRAWPTSLMLMASGPLTGGPLVLMSYAARRIGYGTLGLVQYLNPTLQFSVAVAVFGEPFTRWHALAFPLIWTGLALYSWESWRQERRARSRSISAGTPL